MKGNTVFTEKRREARSRQLKSGKIIFHQSNSTLTCQLRDVSKTGVRLAFETTLGTPEDFQVVVPGAVEKRWARKVWKNNREIGAEFFSTV